MFQIKNLAGCRVSGVDISENALRGAKTYGIEIFKGTITDSPFPKKSFDVITAWSYIEHINNPTEVLSRIYDILKDDGVFIFSCPNYDSFNAKIFKDKWYHLDCPRHLYLYTPRTISELLAKTNFLVEKINYKKSSKGLLGSLQYYFYDNNFEPEHRDGIKHSPLFRAILSPLSRIIYLAKKSDIMLVFARKFENASFNYQQ